MGSLSQVLTEHNDGRAVLKVRNLNVTFKKKHGVLVKKETSIRAVDDVSFDLNKGEVLSVVGESGSGKTTLARCLIKLQNPSSGSIIFEGDDIAHLKGKGLLEYRKKVQIVYQVPYESIIPRLDVLSTLALPIRYLLGDKNPKSIREKATQLLDEVGLNPSVVLRKFPHQYKRWRKTKSQSGKSPGVRPSDIDCR